VMEILSATPTKTHRLQWIDGVRPSDGHSQRQAVMPT
jgi:hypothetical protein